MHRISLRIPVFPLPLHLCVPKDVEVLPALGCLDLWQGVSGMSVGSETPVPPFYTSLPHSYHSDLTSSTGLPPPPP